MKKYITVFTGAGISADSGVPTFRDSNGLWENHKIEDVASPRGFKKNPQLVWDFYRQRYSSLKDIKPNIAHEALLKLEKEAEKRGYEFRLITQNIDGLHISAGSKNVLEIHGDLRTLRCVCCDYNTQEQQFWNDSNVPICPSCGSKLRVNVVWFDEPLPEEEINEAFHAARNSKIMLVIGTSGNVFPAASLVPMTIQNNGTIYECNLEPCFSSYLMYDELCYRFMRGKAIHTVPQGIKDIIQKL